MIPEIKEFVLVSGMEEVDFEIHLSNLERPLSKVKVFTRQKYEAFHIKNLKAKRRHFYREHITRFEDVVHVILYKDAPTNCLSMFTSLGPFTLYVIIENKKEIHLLFDEIRRYIWYELFDFIEDFKKKKSKPNTQDLHNKIEAILSNPPKLLKGELTYSKVFFIVNNLWEDKFLTKSDFLSKEDKGLINKAITTNRLCGFLKAGCKCKVGVTNELFLKGEDVYLKKDEEDKGRKLSMDELFEIIYQNYIAIKKDWLFSARLYPVFGEFLVLEVDYTGYYPIGIKGMDFIEYVADDRYDKIGEFLAINVEGFSKKNYLESQLGGKKFSFEPFCRISMINVPHDENIEEYVKFFEFHFHPLAEFKEVDLENRKMVWHTGESPLHVAGGPEYLYYLGHKLYWYMEVNRFFRDFVGMKIFLMTTWYISDLLNEFREEVKSLKDKMTALQTSKSIPFADLSTDLFNLRNEMLELNEIIRARESFVKSVIENLKNELKAYEILWWEEKGDFSIINPASYIQSEISEYESISKQLDAIIESMSIYKNMVMKEEQKKMAIVKTITKSEIQKINETLPILNYLKGTIESKPFEGKRFIIILHFLKDLIPFLESCEQIGLNPTESILFYKEYRYPYKEAIIDYLKPKGYSIYSLESIDTELQKIKERWDTNKKPVIIVEDGGYIVPRVHASFKDMGEQIIGAVEQTTKGEKSDKKIKKLMFPVVSVAGSQLKSSSEPPHVARAVINNIQQLLKVNFSSKHALLIGYGVIGKEIAKQLKDTLKMNVTVFDLDSVRLLEARQREGFDTKDSCAEAVKDQFLIIGATGETSIGNKEILAMEHNVYLVSASSDQQEIGLRELKALKSKKEDIIENNKKVGTKYKIRGQKKTINLIADGYPITFWAEEGMPNQVSDLIMSLIFLSTIDIEKNYKKLKKEISSDRVNKIAEDYKVADSYLNYYHQR